VRFDRMLQEIADRSAGDPVLEPHFVQLRALTGAVFAELAAPPPSGPRPSSRADAVLELSALE